MDQPPDLTRVAVIGAGEHGSRHAREFLKVPGARLVGIYDLRRERAEALAQELGVLAFGDLGEALDAVEAASIVVPATDHAGIARRAFDRGVDVLLEKPVTRTVEEANDLIERAVAQNRILQVGHVERFNPGVIAAHTATRDPVFFEVHRLGVFSPRSLDVDVVFDLMIHDLDLVLWMVKAEVADVRAVGLPVLSNKVDIANARVEFHNGAVANFTASRVSTERVRKFRYFQPSEYISIDFARRDAIAFSVDRNGPAPQIQFRKLQPPATGISGEQSGCDASVDPLRTELAAFVGSVRTRRQPLVTGVEGRNALALAERVMICIEAHAAQLHMPLGRSSGQSGEL